MTILLTSSVTGPGVGVYVVSNIGEGASSVLPPVFEGVGTSEEAGINSTIAGVGLSVSISIAGVGLKVSSVISAEGGVGPAGSAEQVVGDVDLPLLVLLPEALPSLPPDFPDLPLPELPPLDFPLFPLEHVL